MKYKKLIYLPIYFSLCVALSMPIVVFGSTVNKITSSHFYILPLGTSGGVFEDNLSAYLVAPIQSKQWISLDAGTICSPLKNVSLPQKLNPKIFLQENLKAFLISHAHLDHISGLVLCSPILGNKQILGINTTIDYLRDNIFNWKVWPNFADEGVAPRLKKFRYQRLSLNTMVPIASTTMTVKPFLLDHGEKYPSTAFLIAENGHYLLYFGDTGSDRIEHSGDIGKIWQVIAPLIRSHRLHAIFMEVSFPNRTQKNKLFGHLTPHLFFDELNKLAALVDPKNKKIALKNLPIVVTHIKQDFDPSTREKIIQELKKENYLNILLIFPVSGHLYSF